MSSMLQMVRDKHAKLAVQRLASTQYQHAQIFRGSVCPPSVTPIDRHSGVDSVLLANMAQLLDAIYLELQQRNYKLKKTSRYEIMNHLEGSSRAYENPIFRALCDELSKR